jgi:hydroxyacylglutathione hydrolase
MLILKNTGGIAATNSFLIADEEARKAVVFDAPDHTVGPLLDQAQQRGLEVIGLWLTHGHFDHFADHPEIKRRFPKAQVLIHEAEEPKAQHPEIQTRLFGLPLVITPLKADAYVRDNQQLRIGELTVHVLHTPGHAPGHVVYHLPAERVLVGGDLIIGGSIGRTDLPDSSYEDLASSVRRVMGLPGGTRLLGGHGEETTLADEARYNPFVREILTAGS